MFMPTLDCKRVMFYSPADEAAFFRFAPMKPQISSTWICVQGRLRIFSSMIFMQARPTRTPRFIIVFRFTPVIRSIARIEEQRYKEMEGESE